MKTQKRTTILLIILLAISLIASGCIVYGESAVYDFYRQTFSDRPESEQDTTDEEKKYTEGLLEENISIPGNDESSSRETPVESELQDTEMPLSGDEYQPESDEITPITESSSPESPFIDMTDAESSSPLTPLPTSAPAATTAPTPTVAPTPTTAPAPTSAPSPTTAPSPTAAPTRAPEPTVTPKPENSSAVLPVTLDQLFGKSRSYVTGNFGQPVAFEKSEYGFTWNVYHSNYRAFIMIGIKNEKVVAIYTNTDSLSYRNLSVGASRTSVRNAMSSDYNGPLSSIRKGNTRFILTNTDQKDVFESNEKYVTVFYDNEKGGTLTSILMVDYSTEQSFGYFPEPDRALAESYERISFYLINSVRIRFGMPLLRYDNNMARVAAAHSQDMIDRNYFSHTNPDGERPGDRIRNAGYTFLRCAENIARNHPSAINAHEAYMNSSGHRVNILRDIDFVGIGVRMEKGLILQTQKFITYP